MLCEVNYFGYFYEYILPVLERNKIKIILITTQEHLYNKIKDRNGLIDGLHVRSYKSDHVLNSKHIILWISQNPLYNDKKYFAFPYGLVHTRLAEYLTYLNDNLKKRKSKNIDKCQQSVWSHLPANHIRRHYPQLGDSMRLSTKDYYDKLSNTKYMISTTGDRDDCYRHYECIGLGTIPISNTNSNLKQIFGRDMIYASGDEMLKHLNNNGKLLKYKKPNTNLIYVDFWKDEINKRLNLIGCPKRFK